jgi:hypothetical protein
VVRERSWPARMATRGRKEMGWATVGAKPAVVGSVAEVGRGPPSVPNQDGRPSSCRCKQSAASDNAEGSLRLRRRWRLDGDKVGPQLVGFEVINQVFRTGSRWRSVGASDDMIRARSSNDELSVQTTSHSLT